MAPEKSVSPFGFPPTRARNFKGNLLWDNILGRLLSRHIQDQNHGSRPTNAHNVWHSSLVSHPEHRTREREREGEERGKGEREAE